ncbi:hypothetical protein TNCV_3622701 [Trichonephila clavipes]|nr:hypothetical protein TNCV_3622701 [Trichonephila clavipes]
MLVQDLAVGFASSLYGVLSSLYGVLSSLYGVLSSLYGVLSSLYGMLCILCGVLSVLYGVSSVLYGVLSVLYAGDLDANRYPGVCPLTNAVPGADGTVPESTVDPYQGSDVHCHLTQHHCKGKFAFQVEMTGFLAGTRLRIPIPCDSRGMVRVEILWEETWITI